MKRALPLYCLLVAFSFTTAVTAQTTNPMFRHIPPDAEQVFHINLASLGSKVSWDDISGMIPPPKGSADQEMMKYIKDPSLSGVDFHQGFIIASGHLSKNADSPAYVTILIQLTDSGKLLPIVRAAQKGVHPIHLAGKVSAAGKDKTGYAWDDKMIVVTTIDPSSKHLAKGVSVSPYYALAAAKKSAAALEGFATSIYTTNATFINGFSDDADFHAWTPQGGILKQLAEMSKKKNPLNIKVPNTTSQLHTLTAFRFDAGKITVRTTTIIPPDSAYLYKINNSRPLNTDLITHIPGKDLLGMVNVHFDPSLVPDLLERYHLKHAIDSMLSTKGVAINDILKALKGDFLFAVTHPKQIPDTGKVEPGFYFATTIGDLAAFMNVASKLGLNGDKQGELGKKDGFTLKDNILVVGHKGQTDEFFSTNNPANLEMVNDRVRNSAFSMVVDVKAISGFVKASQRGDSEGQSSRKAQQMLHFLSALDRVTWTSGNYQNGMTESYFEIKMADPSENSLRSLFKLIH